MGRGRCGPFEWYEMNLLGYIQLNCAQYEYMQQEPKIYCQVQIMATKDTYRINVLHSQMIYLYAHM